MWYFHLIFYIVASLCTLTLPKTPLKILNRLNIEYQKQIQSCNSKHYYSTLVDDVTFLRYRQRFLVSYIDQLEKQQKQKCFILYFSMNCRFIENSKQNKSKTRKNWWKTDNRVSVLIESDYVDAHLKLVE